MKKKRIILLDEDVNRRLDRVMDRLYGQYTRGRWTIFAHQALVEKIEREEEKSERSS